MRKILPQSFFQRNTLQVSEELLGKYLVGTSNGTVLARRIIEVEAYDGPLDKASHASRGRTPRTEIMFHEGGCWYVYLVYGMYYLLNVVTDLKDYPAAVLIRSVEGAEGPGRVGKLFGINKELYGKNASKKSGLWIEDRGVKIPSHAVKKLPRIGVLYAREWAKKPYRFSVDPSLFI